VGTQFDNSRTGHPRGIGNREIGKLGGNRHQVISTRTMTLFAADPSVGCSGSARRQDCLGVGDVTKEAAADGIVRQWPTQVFLDFGRVDEMS
jgi:hypothetical protein